MFGKSDNSAPKPGTGSQPQQPQQPQQPAFTPASPVNPVNPAAGKMPTAQQRVSESVGGQEWAENKKPKKGKGAKRSKGALSDADRVKRASKVSAILTGVAVAGIIFSVVYGGYAFSEVEKVTGNMQEVVVAVQDIPAGTTVSSEMVDVKEVPAEFISQGHIDAGSFSEDDSKIIGKTAINTIYANQQLTPSMFYGLDNHDKLATSLEPGYFATTMSVNVESGFAGMLYRGDYVDIISISTDPATNEAVAEVALSKVKVISLDANLTEPGQSSYSTITVQLSHEDSLKLQEIRKSGDIALILHSEINHETGEFNELDPETVEQNAIEIVDVNSTESEESAE